MSKLAAGFFCDEGVPFNEAIANEWAKWANLDGMPLCFRAHNWKRDEQEAMAALQWGDKHGMRFFLSVVAPDAPPLVTWANDSHGNGHDWRDATITGDHIQDDSGPVGAMNIMRRRGIVWTPILFHAYGQSGMRKENLHILAEEGAKRGCEIIWSECGWGFPGKDKTISDRPDVQSAGAGAWTREAIRAANSVGISCAVYKPKYFFRQDGGLNDAGAALFGLIAARPLTPPRLKAWKMSWDLRSA